MPSGDGRQVGRTLNAHGHVLNALRGITVPVHEHLAVRTPVDASHIPQIGNVIASTGSRANRCIAARASEGGPGPDSIL